MLNQKSITVILVLFCIVLFDTSIRSQHYVIKAEEKDNNSNSLSSQEEIERKLSEEEIINIIKNNDVSKVSIIKKLFENSNEEVNKTLYAAILWRLGEKENLYWDYLVSKSIQAVESDMSHPLYFDDDKGKFVRGKHNPEFLDWCEKNNVDIPLATTRYIYIYPAIIQYLGLSGDKRGFNIILTALESNNMHLVLAATNALGILNDKRGIDYIVETAKKHPEYSYIIAPSLAYIDEPRANEIMEEMIDDEKEIKSLKYFAKKKDYSLILYIFIE